jgi:hypothetical protein
MRQRLDEIHGHDSSLSHLSLLIVLVALIDWSVDLNVSFGFLYLFPVLIIGLCIRRWQIAVIAGLCTLLAEWFDPFPWNFATGIARDLL